MIELPNEIVPVRTLFGDCLSLLKQLPTGCIDAIVTDPPYGQTNERYDSPQVISLRSEVWQECARVCKPNAALISFAGSPTYHRIATAIETGGWKIRQMWGWIYRDGLVTSAYPKDGFDRLAPAFDPIVFATRGKILLNMVKQGKPWKLSQPRSVKSPMSDRFRPPATMNSTGAYPRAIVSDGVEPFEYFALSRTVTRRDTVHPNEKPLELMRWLVDKLPRGIILDPFAGSGTTGLAAILEGHQAILIEQDQGFFEICWARIEQAMLNKHFQ